MWLRKFFIYSNNIEKDSYVWNMIGSMLMAFQSVIFLMVLTRTVGVVEAGVFTIAYANANLFLTIGKYGMRYYQVSDVKQQFTFEVYKKSRYITTIIMFLCSAIYTAYSTQENGYTISKSIVIILMCVFKLVDSVEDVYHGYFQQILRLDVASKGLSVRMLTTIIIYCIALVISKNQIIALALASVYTMLFLWWFVKVSAELLPLKRSEKNYTEIKQLLINCCPLFIGTFLSFYLGNAPKYAIDGTLTDEMQACYGFISMPVFVIGLLNGFVFNPVIGKLSLLWNEGETSKFAKILRIQIYIVFGITLICLGGAYLVGVPVLSIMYNTDLTSYKQELLILLIGGGLLGISGLLNTVITIMRQQKLLLLGYGISSIVAFLLSKIVVQRYEMMGASILYVVLMLILCLCFLVIFFISWKKRKVSA